MFADMEQIFFELIRVAIGKQVCLSHTPTADEWGKLYAMAKKQSLVGICFAGVQELNAQRQAPNSWGNEKGEQLYLQWMGMAAKIQQRNDLVNRQCVEVQKKLADAGIPSLILKGQGVACVYCEPLRGLRQSGDIDVLCLSYFEKLEDWLRTDNIAVNSVSFHHFDVALYNDTDVELHFSVGHLINRYADKEYQKFIQAESCAAELHKLGADFTIKSPSSVFNLIYLLAHMQRHYFSEGIGMRHVMDYYYVLKTSTLSKEEKTKIADLLKTLMLYDFASAVIWVIKYVTMDLEFCDFIKEDGRKGQFLLNDIMMGGNFGHYKEKNHRDLNDSHLVRFAKSMIHSLRFAKYFPNETLWYPIDYTRMFIDNYLMRHRCRHLIS